MRLDHHADNLLVARCELPCDILGDLNLTLEFLLLLACATSRSSAVQPGLSPVILGRRIDMHRVVVRHLAAAQNNVAVLVTVVDTIAECPALVTERK